MVAAMHIIGTEILEDFGRHRPAARSTLAGLSTFLSTVALADESDLRHHFAAILRPDGMHQVLRFEDAKFEVCLRLNYAAQVVCIERIESL